jgi:diguanylate cyclase (GGDEF)-like protein/PAS domain S-box-containing protein
MTGGTEHVLQQHGTADDEGGSAGGPLVDDFAALEVEMLGLAFTGAPVGMAIGRADTGETTVNAALCALLDCDPVAAAAAIPELMTRGGDRHEIDAREISTDGPDTVEWELLEQRRVLTDGSTIWTRVRVQSIVDGGGEPRFHIVSVEDITLERDQQLRLEVREGRRGTALEGSLDGIFVLEAERDHRQVVVDFVVRDMNHRAQEILGHTREIALGGRLTELLPGDLQRPFFERYAAVVESGEALDEEFALDLGPGPSRWIQQQVVRFGDGVVITARDVTTVRSEEEELRRSRDFLQRVLDTDPNLIFVESVDGQLVLVNQAVADLLGTTVVELLGRPDPVTPLRADETIDYDGIDRRVLETMQPVEVDEVITRPNGEQRRFHTVKVPLPLDSTVLVLGISADTTERDIAAYALRASEQRYQALARNSSDVVALANRDREVEWVSPAVEHVLGYTPDEFRQSFADQVHPEDRQRYTEFFDRALSQDNVETQIEIRIRHASGEWRWAETSARNLLADPEVAGVVLHARDVTDRHRAESELAHQALHDPLTGLPNRSLLLDRLERAIARAERVPGTSVVVIFLDLDRFKVVNDSLGHATGDRLLVAVARRLRDAVRPSDTVARLGGDEFVICCEDVASGEQALDVATRILEEIHKPFAIGEREVYVTTSIGIAITEGATPPESLLRDADAAMYEAKDKGRDRYEVFDDDVRARVLWRMEIEHDLHRALAGEDFRLSYQPVVDLRSGLAIGVEALLRWHHPRRGVLLPTDFIPIAEETGMVLQIGEWVIEEACRQMKAWEGLANSSLNTMWVNLSARQLELDDLAERVQDILERHDVAPGSLGIEVTESVLMGEFQRTGTELRELEALGVPLAIDDFGTGYSSLSYLKRFPVDVLKIDRSFVSGLGDGKIDASIASAVIGLGHLLGMQVSAEGIETPEQLDEIRALGCDTACGYFLARPLPPADVEQLLTAGPLW